MKKRPKRSAAPRKRPSRPKVARAGDMHRRRVRFVTFCFVVLFGGIASRLVLLQLDPDMRFHDEDLAHVGQIQLERPRGEILDRNGRVLATNRPVSSLSVNPSAIDDPEVMAQWLAARLDRPIHDIRERVTRTDPQGRPMKFVWLQRRMDAATLASLGDLDEAPEPEALIVREESLRYYPERDLAAHVLGYANREHVGSAGVELRFDEYLSSKAGRRKSRVDSKRNLMGFRTLEFEPPTGGDDVRLTIDAAMQFSLESELDRALEEKNARRGVGVLMDPHTGAIYALASRPAYDPNTYTNFDEDILRNHAVIDTFEPGSAFKIVTAAAALQSGLIRPSDTIDCLGGSFNPYGHTIHDTHPMDVAPFTECFAASSNIAIIKVAALLGPARLEEWIRRFGFGTKTHAGLPGEEPGIFRPQRKWSRLSMGSLPMGQEISVTILQLARAFSAIANGGMLVQPHIVEQIESTDGSVRVLPEGEPPRRILSEETAAIMRELCREVVTHEEGTGSYAAIREYSVGGKTGTAQVADLVHGGYKKDHYTAVFAGFAPATNPRIVCVIVVQEPMIRLHYGGYVCGPVFSEVVRDALTRLNVPPDLDPEPSEKLPVPKEDYVPQRLALSIVEPANEGGTLDGLELIARPEDATTGGPVLPSFVGMTKREAKALSVSLGLPWDPQGAGRVVSQDPPAGTPLGDVRQCRLVFAGGSQYDVES